MSLINPKDGWIRFDGTPVQGITPPQVRLRSGALTPDRLAAVSDLYSKFTTAKRLSLAGGGFFTADRRLPDGTIVRMVAINDVDHVHIWAADTEPEEVEGITFWCIPWDSEWIDEAYTEVFTIPRWLEIGAGAEEVVAAEFLQDLSRNEKYEPPSDGLYPGNQTWFAPPPHPSAGIVVSWWGQMRRYRTGGISQAIDSASQWKGKDTGGIAGALAGQMFLMPTVPTFTDPKPVRTPPANRPAVWLNGVMIPAGAPVSSACLGYRDGAQVIRCIAPMSGGSVTIRELSGDKFYDIAVIGVVDLLPATMGLGTPRVINGTPSPPASWTATARQAQPFYWNSDGTVAIGIVEYFAFYGSFSDEWSRTTSAVVKITVGPSGCTAEVVTTTNSESHRTHGGGLLDSALEFSRPIAADFRGNDEVVVRTHISEARNGTTAGTSAEHSGSATAQVDTWASVNAGQIFETLETKVSEVSDTFSSSASTETKNYSSSGVVSWWAVLAGDLRGIFVLHGAPLNLPVDEGLGEVVVGSRTATYSFASSSGGFAHHITNTYNAAQGKLLLCDADGAASALDNIVAPFDAALAGTASNIDGTQTASGPYGGGPGSDGAVPWGNLASTPTLGPVSSTVTSALVDFDNEPNYWSDVVLTGSSITPDGKTQYLGALFIAMAEPTSPLSSTAYVIDKWFHEGNEFTPLYPPQPDPDNPGATVPFPHRGGHAILLDPIFTGPLP